MHYIQKHILDSLRKSESVRYTKLNPGEVESGHFRYHMKQLVQDGYVEQIERGLYKLTVKGQQVVDKLSEGRVNALPMPKVITYTLLKDGDNVILHKKPKQPYMNLLNMIGGKIHEGETTQQASVREVNEKANILINTPRLAGIFEILISKDSAIFTHAIAYVHVAHVASTDFASTNFQTINVSKLSNTKNLAPDFMPIFTRLSESSIQAETLEIVL